MMVRHVRGPCVPNNTSLTVGTDTQIRSGNAHTCKSYAAGTQIGEGKTV